MKSLTIFFTGLCLVFFISCDHKCPMPDPAPSNTTSSIETWLGKTSPTANFLLDVHFPSSSVGYISGVTGTILKTADGGETWNSLTSGTTQDLYSICFLDTSNGYTVGNNGTILHTSNGGASWSAISSPITKHLRNVYFINSNIGFIVGATGSMLKTTNGGANWSAATTGTSVDLLGIFFTDVNTGYISGQYYTMLKTTNGGASWTALNTGLTGTDRTPLTSLYFTDANTGYAVGGYGYPTGFLFPAVIIKTVNAGASWTELTSPAGMNYLLKVKFADANIGYIVGGTTPDNNGIILKTTDAGSSWAFQLNTLPRLYGLTIIDSTHGFAVGNNGSILKGF